MATVTKTIELPKETSELCDAIANLVVVAKQLLADGWQPGTDLPALAMAAMAALPAALAGLGDIKTEFAADKGKLVVALAVAVDAVL